MENPPNFWWGDTVPLVNAVEKTFNLPVALTNDANAAALGELEYGQGKGMKNFVVLTLGTGLGGGIITNGELLIGEHGMAAEIGHLNVNPTPMRDNAIVGLRDAWKPMSRLQEYGVPSLI